MRTYKIAAMGGDGIGPEVVQAGVQVLKVRAERDGRFTLDFQDFDWGSDYYRTHGVMMPAKARNGLDYSVVAVGARIEYGPCGTRHAGSELAVLIGD